MSVESGSGCGWGADVESTSILSALTPNAALRRDRVRLR